MNCSKFKAIGVLKLKHQGFISKHISDQITITVKCDPVFCCHLFQIVAMQTGCNLSIICTDVSCKKNPKQKESTALNIMTINLPCCK